jgi:DNA-binding Lrp family transcriptional regulator
MDKTDRKLLDRLQADFPLVPRPFAAIGEELGLSEPEVIARAASLQRRGLIRRIGPVLDPEKVGRVGALVAASVPAEQLEAVAAKVSACERVTHNYERAPRRGRCPYNLWFTLTAPSADELARAVAAIGRATGLAVALFPVRRKFKISVRFPLADDANG